MAADRAKDIGERLAGNSYPGRGIVVGKTESGCAAIAYFIMGRSENSRNRVLKERGGALFTEPFDPSKVRDPSLIIYPAIRRFEDKLIVTNGDQTDTILAFLKEGKSFGAALKTRSFEPDAPNFTPRISALVSLSEPLNYEMSILKSADGVGSSCDRFFFCYEPIAGEGSFLHTYLSDGDPLPSFQGEPERVKIPCDIDEFASSLWAALDEKNRISLFVKYISLSTEKEETRLINKNER